MKFKFLTSVLTIATAGTLYSQTTVMPNDNYRGCGTQPPSNQWDTWFNAKVKEYEQKVASGKVAAGSYTIPVIVHVIHGGQNVGTFPNVSQAQVNSQIPILNADYAGSGYGVSGLPSVFSGLVANTGITFCLAKFDANGNCLTEPGIDRIDYHTITNTNPNSLTTASSFMSYFDATVKPATIWDPNQFLNIWISDVSGAAQLLGYATFPAGSGLTGLSGFGSSSNDGVWVWTRSFGTTGFVNYPYNKGRTTTHEIGHWVGLRHVWGDGTCATDYCNDTPPSQTSNFGCPTHPFNVGGCSGNTTGEMFQNFMDYSDDACLALFTTNQNSRIQTAMINGTYRKNLTASSATQCSAPASAPAALFSLSSNTVCVDSVAYTLNQSSGMPCPAYTWSLTPSTGFTITPNATSANPSLVFSTPGNYTLTLVATSTLGTSTYVDYIDAYDCNDAEGIAEQNAFARSISIQPNPGSGEFVIATMVQNQQAMHIKVYSAVGSLVWEKTAAASDKTVINLQNMPNGVYNVTLENGTNKAVKKLVILK